MQNTLLRRPWTPQRSTLAAHVLQLLRQPRSLICTIRNVSIAEVPAWAIFSGDRCSAVDCNNEPIAWKF